MAKKYSSVRLGGEDKINLISGIATMLSAGIPILETVNSLLDEAKGNTKIILEAMRDDLAAGQFMHETLGKFPKVFDKVTINLVRAAEEAGNLEQTLADVQDSIRKQMEFNDKIKSAMMYPVFVMVVFVGVLLMILVVVVPKISQVFSRMNMELPLPTRIMMQSSNALVGHPFIVTGSVVVFFVVLALIFKYQRHVLTRVLFALPIVRGLVKNIDLTRFTRSLYLLLTSGLPIVFALELASEVVVRDDVQKMLQTAQEMVVSGKSLSEGLKTDNHIMPGSLVKLIEVGEKSGTLDVSLRTISESLDYKVSKDLASATALLEPIMLVG
ncbi:type II secretion system F family protein, partial [Candidatus Woesebacteria bacterium]|nr:type II secretion system F family protein [Candidatus Woesebacteria bacterium]